MKRFLLYVCFFINVACFGQAPNTWVRKADFSGLSRYGAICFSINNKGYIGCGHDSAGAYLKDFWEYDQASDTWTQKADFGGSARYYAVSFSIGGKGYVGTGSATDGLKNDLWEWDQGSNIWAQKANFGGAVRWYASGFSIGNKGYIGLGNNNGTFKIDFWEWDQATNIWSQKANFGGTARFLAIGFSIGTKGYFGTGYDGAFQNDFWEWDQATNIWTQKANFGGLSRYYATGFSIGTKGYIGLGWDGISPLQNDFWEYDPSSNTWIQKANLGGASRDVAVGFSIGVKGHIGVGGAKNNSTLNDFWEYTPSDAATMLIGGISTALCGGSTINIPYTAYNTFIGGNVFTAQLSNSNGSFVSPINIGTVTSTLSGIISTVIPSNTPAGSGYRIRIVSSNPVVIGSDNGNNITIAPPSLLSLKLFIQGYYITGGTMRIVLFNEKAEANSSSTQVDTVVVELHNSTSPYAIIETYKGVLQTIGILTCYFSCNVTGHSYYIAVRHRNVVQTWSAAPVAFTTTTNYDFTTAANKAYANNMIQMEPGKWAFYSGDINQDENIDLTDFPLMDYGIVYGLSGYYAADLNGDGNVDLLDFPFLNAGINNGIFSRHP